MGSTPAQLYLNMVKRAITFMLWSEPPLPITEFNYKRSFLPRTAVAAVSKLLARMELQVCKIRKRREDPWRDGRVRSAYALTMIGLKRLDNIQHCMEKILEDGVEGDFIETGVWRGGACILMRAVLAAYGIEDRRVFVADSFEGLPKPDAAQYPVDDGDNHHTKKFLAVSQAEVEQNFERFGLLDNKVVFVNGWFKDSLPKAPIGKLAVLRLDGDMYSSTIESLEALYPKLSPGGFCIVDDWQLDGSRRAVEDYRAANGSTEPLMDIDWAGEYWRKEDGSRLPVRQNERPAARSIASASSSQLVA